MKFQTINLVLLLWFWCCEVRESISKFQNGGWRTFDSQTLLNATGFDLLQDCNIDKQTMPLFSQHWFDSVYLDKRPVIVRDHLMMKSWSLTEKWHRSRILDWLGEQPLNVDNVAAIAASGLAMFSQDPFEVVHNSEKGNRTSDAKLLEKAAQEHHQPLVTTDEDPEGTYSFNSYMHHDPMHLGKDAPRPSLFHSFDDAHLVRDQFAIGGTGTGLPWHQHGAAWNTVVYGKKLWLLRDQRKTQMLPVCDTKGRQSTVAWLKTANIRSLSTAIPVMYCVVEAGETIYVPPYFEHATINLGPTLSRSQLHMSDSWSANSDKKKQKTHVHQVYQQFPLYNESLHHLQTLDSLATKLLANKETMNEAEILLQARRLTSLDTVRAVCRGDKLFTPVFRSVVESLIELVNSVSVAESQPTKVMKLLTALQTIVATDNSQFRIETCNSISFEAFESKEEKCVGSTKNASSSDNNQNKRQARRDRIVAELKKKTKNE